MMEKNRKPRSVVIAVIALCSVLLSTSAAAVAPAWYAAALAYKAYDDTYRRNKAAALASATNGAVLAGLQNLQIGMSQLHEGQAEILNALGRLAAVTEKAVSYGHATAVLHVLDGLILDNEETLIQLKEAVARGANIEAIRYHAETKWYGDFAKAISTFKRYQASNPGLVEAELPIVWEADRLLLRLADIDPSESVGRVAARYLPFIRDSLDAQSGAGIVAAIAKQRKLVSDQYKAAAKILERHFFTTLPALPVDKKTKLTPTATGTVWCGESLVVSRTTNNGPSYSYYSGDEILKFRGRKAKLAGVVVFFKPDGKRTVTPNYDGYPTIDFGVKKTGRYSFKWSKDYRGFSEKIKSSRPCSTFKKKWLPKNVKRVLYSSDSKKNVYNWANRRIAKRIQKQGELDSASVKLRKLLDLYHYNVQKLGFLETTEARLRVLESRVLEWIARNGGLVSNPTLSIETRSSRAMSFLADARLRNVKAFQLGTLTAADRQFQFAAERRRHFRSSSKRLLEAHNAASGDHSLAFLRPIVTLFLLYYENEAAIDEFLSGDDGPPTDSEGGRGDSEVARRPGGNPSPEPYSPAWDDELKMFQKKVDDRVYDDNAVLAADIDQLANLGERIARFEASFDEPVWKRLGDKLKSSALKGLTKAALKKLSKRPSLGLAVDLLSPSELADSTLGSAANAARLREDYNALIEQIFRSKF